MRKILYILYYRCKQPERQVEIDRCLQINLNHPGFHKVVVLREPGTPLIPHGSISGEIINLNDRLTYGSWMSLAKQEKSVTPSHHRVEGKGQRNILKDRNLWRNFDTFKLLLKPLEVNSKTWGTNDFAELVLFCEKSPKAQLHWESQQK